MSGYSFSALLTAFVVGSCCGMVSYGLFQWIAGESPKGRRQ